MKQVKMKAVQSTKYGSPEVFQLSEVERPDPKPHEILVRNYATTVTAADIMMRKGKPLIGRLYLGIKKPKRTIQGFEFAGEVAKVGDAVTIFEVGDRVFGGTTALGGYGEYVCIDQNAVVTTIPDSISYEQAAPVNGSAITVMNFLHRLGNIQQGQKVLVNGASGGLGTYAVQIAKHFGAEVTGVCSTSNVDLVKSLSADKVIDYKKEDFTKNGIHYDIIFDTVGKRSYTECKNSLTKNGLYLSPVANPLLFLQMLWTSFRSGKKAKTSATGLLPVKVRLKYFIDVKKMMSAGQVKTVIDRHYQLSDMSAAHKYVETGHKKGNVIVAI